MALGDPKMGTGPGLAILAFAAALAWATYHGGWVAAFTSLFKTASRQRARETLQAERAKVGKTIDTAKPVAERLAAVEAFYANELTPVHAGMSDVVPSQISRRSIEAGVADAASRLQGDMGSVNSGHAGVDIAFAAMKEFSGEAAMKSVAIGVENARFTRTLRDMTEGERATLRLGDMLVALGVMREADMHRVTIPIVWNDGKCGFDTDVTKADKRIAVREALKVIIAGTLGDATQAAELVQQHLRAALEGRDLTSDEKALLERYLVRGARWMTPDEGRAALCKDAASPSALRLGTFPGTSQDLLFDMRESLVTIAPPGSGKSQAHVLRNLLMLKAPAVVLDIKGEMFAGSFKWRAANVGNVQVYAPSVPQHSAHYNPLDHVRAEPGGAWEDARRLAELLVVPTTGKGGDDYFERRARDMIATAVADVSISEQGARRTMQTVLDRLYVSDPAVIAEWCDHLGGLSTQLRRQADALRGMPDKQREGVLDSARAHLEVWQSPALEALSADSTFTPESLRAKNGTLYIVVPLEDIKRLSSVLRVIIGQTVHALSREVPDASALPVTFFLDELPRLGRMDVVEEGLDVGRGYGLRFWLFAQNLGQLETAYPNADGMMANCAVRCFMNPDEKAAQWLAKHLGEREGLIDGKRKPLAEPTELTGPAFANAVVAFIRANHPARLDKVFAYADPAVADRAKTAEAASA